ncbi:hypothetical protein PL371_16660 [Tenacibaculum maritimum]|nr:hypothetical protein [Tenacibaculum maritimum]MDB0613464.1 hypothetical protein [Tenacibaculum maritimum]
MKQKYYIIIILIVSIIGVGKHYYDKEQYNSLINKIKEDLETEKQSAIRLKDSIILNRNDKINVLIQDNEKAKTKSNYWYNMAKRNNVNPNYDIDFITAADILSKSKYQSGKTNSYSKQRKDN